MTRDVHGAPEPNSFLPEVRPLVVPVSPADDESLIGMIARSTAANVLGATWIILGEVGPPLLTPGLAGQELAEYSDRLALKLGCEYDAIARRFHHYVDPPSEDPRQRKSQGQRPVHWGEGAIERHHLDLRARFVSPSALKISPHHRSDWHNTLLPYCVETLEPLVAHCGHCDERLGWRQARGIGVCEHCRLPIPPSTAARLDDEWADDYRRFARLVSVVPEVRRRELERLHPDLQALEPTALIRLVISLGRAMDTTSTTFRRGTIVERGSPETAVSVARGFDMLRNWPNRLRAAIAQTISDGKLTHREVQSRLRRIGKFRPGTSIHDSLLRTAVPEAFEMLYRSMSFDEPVVLACQAAKMIGIDISELRTLENAKQISGTDTMDGERLYRQYPERRVTEIARAWRQSKSAAATAWYLGVPVYCLEQLSCLHEVVPELMPAVLTLDPNLRVVKASSAALISDLERSARREKPPTDAISLAYASRGRGGGMKPWGSAIAMLRTGEVPCWRDPDVADPAPRGSNFAGRTLIRPADAPKLFSPTFREADHPDFPFSHRLSLSDAAEILNIDYVQLVRAIGAGELSFGEDKGRAQYGDRSPVLSLAMRTISASELGFMLNQNYSYIARMMVRHPEVRRDCIGWQRDQVLGHWWKLVDSVVADRAAPRRRRVLPQEMPVGHAELAFDRLESSLSCIR